MKESLFSRSFLRPTPQGQQIAAPAPVVVKGLECGLGLIAGHSPFGKSEIIKFLKRTDDNFGYIAVVKDVRSGKFIHLTISAPQMLPDEACVEAIVDILAPGQLEALDKCLEARTPEEKLCLQNIYKQLGIGTITKEALPPNIAQPTPAPTPPRPKPSASVRSKK